MLGKWPVKGAKLAGGSVAEGLGSVGLGGMTRIGAQCGGMVTTYSWEWGIGSKTAGILVHKFWNLELKGEAKDFVVVGIGKIVHEQEALLTVVV